MTRMLNWKRLTVITLSFMIALPVSTTFGAQNNELEHLRYSTIPVGTGPYAIAIDSNNNKIYVTNRVSDTVSVIDSSVNKVVATVEVDNSPYGIAFNPSNNIVYVANYGSNSLSLIDGSANMLVNTTPKSGAYAVSY